MKLQNRGSIDVEHKKWYDCAVALGDGPSIPQICKCQILALALMHIYPLQYGTKRCEIVDLFARQHNYRMFLNLHKEL